MTAARACVTARQLHWIRLRRELEFRKAILFKETVTVNLT